VAGEERRSHPAGCVSLDHLKAFVYAEKLVLHICGGSSPTHTNSITSDTIRRVTANGIDSLHLCVNHNG
jgi:hypothetical protein